MKVNKSFITINFKAFYRFNLETIMKTKAMETSNAILNVEFSPTCDLLAISYGNFM